MSYPCDLQERITDAGGALEACLVELAVSDEAREAYRRALVAGELDDLREMVADTLAAMAGLHKRELLAILLEGGFSYSQPIPGKPDAEGDTPIIGHRLIQNPRAIPFLELSKLLGLTADQQAATPKARGETERNISEADHLKWMRRVAEETPGR